MPKRGSSSSRTTSQPWHLHATQCLWCVTLVLTVLTVTSPNALGAFVAQFTQEAEIVSKQEHSGVCVDGSTWTSASGACDRIVCVVALSGYYTVQHSCRPVEPYENPDDDNCVWVSDSLQTFPDCCPKLDCAEAGALSTVDPLLCRDLAQSFSCQVWKNLTSGCSDPSSDVYAITQTYCNNTCG